MRALISSVNLIGRGRGRLSGTFCVVRVFTTSQRGKATLTDIENQQNWKILLEVIPWCQFTQYGICVFVHVAISKLALATVVAGSNHRNPPRGTKAGLKEAAFGSPELAIEAWR